MEIGNGRPLGFRVGSVVAQQKGAALIIGSYGRFWDRDQVDWAARSWRLLGRRGINRGTIRLADFRRARGVYVLYNEVGVYYVGLASSNQGIGGRLKDHLADEHGAGWSRFSWFSFDGPGEAQDADGVFIIDQYDSVDLDAPVLIRDLEALLQAVMQPFANKSATKFAEGDEWIQVATATPEFRTFEQLKDRLVP